MDDGTTSGLSTPFTEALVAWFRLPHRGKQAYTLVSIRTGCQKLGWRPTRGDFVPPTDSVMSL